MGYYFTIIKNMSKQSGTCKWFNSKKGYGFIKPDNEGEELFVHQSEIKAEGFRSLGEGEKVEYKIETANGKSKAVDVTGPNGDNVKVHEEEEEMTEKIEKKPED